MTKSKQDRPQQQRHYICAECGRAVSRNGTGLGTWTCSAHPKRQITVVRRVDSGKEAEHAEEASVPVVRHTKVRVQLERPER